MEEILTRLKPSLVVEFGTHCGGSALYSAQMLQAITPYGRVLSVDVEPSKIHPRVREHLQIQCLHPSTIGAVVGETISRLRAEAPGPIFAIVDSNHECAHVLAKILPLRTVLVAGDYLIVEDTSINGHPVLPNCGEGPMKALAAYERMFPSD